MTTRRELIEAVAARYRGAGRAQKKEILDEFVKVTGFHRKHAIRVLKKSPRRENREPQTKGAHLQRSRSRGVDDTLGGSGSNLWKAPPPSDRGSA